MSPVKYFKEVIYQTKKVKWPSFPVFMNTFSVILVVVIVSSLILYFESWTGIQLMNSLGDAFSGIASTVTSGTSV